MRRRIASCLLAGAMALGGLVAVTAPANEAMASNEPGEVTAWQWNIAGGYHGSHSEQVDAVVGSIVEHDADFVVVNELCWNQYEMMKERLLAADWPLGTSYARFTKMDDRGSCEGGGYSSVGFGIFSKHQLSAGIERVQLPTDEHGIPGRAHYLACATTEDATKLCGTHITPTREDDQGNPYDIRSEQIRALTEKVDSYVAAGDAVMVAGDFNMQPHESGLDRLYSSNVSGTVNQDNFGKFRELDDNDSSHCLGYGEFTKDNGEGPEECGPGGRKLDLIFVGESRISGSYSADALGISQSCGGPCSDHHAVVGTVRIT